MDEQNFEYFKRACPQRVMKTCRLCGDSGCIDSENLCTDWFNCQRRQIAKLNAALAEYQARFPAGSKWVSTADCPSLCPGTPIVTAPEVTNE